MVVMQPLLGRVFSTVALCLACLAEVDVVVRMGPHASSDVPVAWPWRFPRDGVARHPCDDAMRLCDSFVSVRSLPVSVWQLQFSFVSSIATDQVHVNHTFNRPGPCESHLHRSLLSFLSCPVILAYPVLPILPIPTHMPCCVVSLPWPASCLSTWPPAHPVQPRLPPFRLVSSRHHQTQ